MILKIYSQLLFSTKLYAALLALILIFQFPRFVFSQSIDTINTYNIAATDSINLRSYLVPGIADQDEQNNAAFAEKEFNHGVISDPFLLLQGQTPGVQIYNVGGDPNIASYVRMRGLNSILGNSQPLIVIDGVVESSIDNIDVFDIDEIKILRKGSEASKYGIRSASGVVEITTKGASTDKTLKLDVNIQSGLSSSVSPIKAFTADEYLATAKGFDLGGETVWFDQINRRAPSFIGNIALSGKGGPFRYRVSANYRDVNGVLLHSGFKTYNTRTRVVGTFLDDRLAVDLSASYTDRRQSHSFKEAFYQATTHNPTAPIAGDDAPFAFNSDQYGGFFQQLGLFNAYNPVALLEQNQNITQTNIANINAIISYKLLDQLTLNVRAATQSGSKDHRQYFSTKSLYKGNARNPLKKGSGEFDNTDNSFVLLDSYLEYRLSADDFKFNITTGMLYQEDQQDRLSFTIAGFENNIVDIDDESTIMQQANNALNYTQVQRLIPDKITTSTYFRATGNYKEKLWLDANLSMDDSSLLGTDVGVGIFGGLDIAYELFSNAKTRSLRPHLGIGLTGGLPEQRGLAFARSRDIVLSDGFVERYQTNAANTDLSWEKNREINMGLDFELGSFNGSVDVYQRNITDLITKEFYDIDVWGSDQIYRNNTSLSSRGVELDLAYVKTINTNVAYASRLNISANRMMLNESVDQAELLGFFSGPGLASTNLIQYKEGESLGEILGYVFTGVDEMGEPIYEDFNGDGTVQLFGDPFGDASDYQVLGSSLPKLEFGWSNTIAYKNWECSFLLRGAIGHSKINSTRMYHEVIPDSKSPYNFVSPELTNGDAKYLRFDSRFVERADFLKLDNIQLTRVFNVGSSENVKRLSCSLIGQNMLTFTSYTGVDPEPILADFLFPSEESSLISGIDRRVQYYPSRTISIRLSLDI